MNEELQKALAALLAKTTSAAEAGASFLQAELPEVIQQLLMWKAVESGVHFLLAAIATGLLVWGAKRFWQWCRAEDSYMESLVMLPAIAASVFAVIAMSSLDWLQILIAPKVYLIEYAASLAK